MRKIAFLVVLSLILSTVLSAVKIKFVDCNFKEFLPPYQDAVKEWGSTINNAVKSEVLDCLPGLWKERVNTRIQNKKEISVMICDKKLDDEEHRTGESFCAGNWLGGIVLRTGTQYQKRKKECGCEESSFLHELIQVASNVDEADDPKIDGCVLIALQNVINCTKALPPGDSCNCKDQNGNKSPCEKGRN